MNSSITKTKLKDIKKSKKWVPLISDTLGKNLLKKNKKLTIQFLMDVFHFDFKIKKISFIDTELETENINDYKLISDLVILINDQIIVDVELCRDYYNNHKERLLGYVYKLASTNVLKGKKYETDVKMVCQLIMAGKESVGKDSKVLKLCDIKNNEIMDDNLEVRVHYIEFHRKRYYNSVDGTRIDAWFAFFGSRCFEEMDKILKKLVDDKTRIECIRSVYKMIEDSGIVIDLGTAEYCRKYMEKKIANAEKRWARKERKKIEESALKIVKEKDIQMVKRMIEENASYDFISKVTELSLDEIKEIEKGINQEKS